MDWVVVTLVLGTGAFLVVILREYQRYRLVRHRRIHEIRDQSQKIEATLLEAREQEAKLKIELESAQRDLSEMERVRGTLQKTLASKTQKRR